MKNHDPRRRRFLAQSVASLALASPFAGLVARATAATRDKTPVAALRPVRCGATGIALLELPRGFEYVSFGWTGDPLADDVPTPGRHDGMAVVRAAGRRLTLIRNHEIYTDGGAYADGDIVYDAQAGGGCTVIEFDAAEGKLLSARAGLAGTVFNCAGGATPWGSWLSGEEWAVGPGDPWRDGSRNVRFEREHGLVFEVRAEAGHAPRPLPDLGRFQHEAAAVDPKTGIVYLTEDRGAAGFYRFVPKVRGELARGGRLEMLAVEGATDLRRKVPKGARYETRWLPIDEPLRLHTPGTRDAGGVHAQGAAAGGATFARLEGCWYAGGTVYFTSTSGGDAARGQVWAHDVRGGALAPIYESPDAETLDMPDNLTVSPGGGLVLCEDGDRAAMLLHGLTRDGRLVPIARNAVRLDGERNALQGDFRDREFAGACFSPDGRWLFVNVQTPGISFAIRGPWRELGL